MHLQYSRPVNIHRLKHCRKKVNIQSLIEQTTLHAELQAEVFSVRTESKNDESGLNTRKLLKSIQKSCHYYFLTPKGDVYLPEVPCTFSCLSACLCTTLRLQQREVNGGPIFFLLKRTPLAWRVCESNSLRFPTKRSAFPFDFFHHAMQAVYHRWAQDEENLLFILLHVHPRAAFLDGTGIGKPL